MDLSFKELRCPACQSELEQGSITASQDVQMVKRCASQCGFWMIMVIPHKDYDYSVQRELKPKVKAERELNDSVYDFLASEVKDAGYDICNFSIDSYNDTDVTVSYKSVHYSVPSAASIPYRTRVITRKELNEWKQSHTL